MKRFILAGLMVTSLLFFAPADAHACKKGCDKDTKKVCKISKIKKTAKMLWKSQECLGITDEQMAKIKDAKYDGVKNIIKLKSEVDLIKVDLKRAMWSPMIDTSAVHKLIEKKYDTKAKIAKSYVSTIAKFQEALTEEQRAKVLEKIAKKKMGDCDECGKKKDCHDCKKDKKCKKCAMKSGGKFCPITGKPLHSKGSGSDK